MRPPLSGTHAPVSALATGNTMKSILHHPAAILAALGLVSGTLGSFDLGTNYAEAPNLGVYMVLAGVWFGLDIPAPIMNRGFAAVVAVPAWAAFMKQATAGDPADWFTAPPDVEKVTICRTSGQLATEACRHGWSGLNGLQAGLTELPGIAAGPRPAAAIARGPAAPIRSTVYDDYFQIGSAPTENCTVHGVSGLFGVAGSEASTPGFTPAGGPLEASAIGSSKGRPHKIVSADGRTVWVMKQ